MRIFVIMRRVYHFRLLQTTVVPLLGSLAFVLACICLLRFSHNPFHWVAAVVGILFFGGCFFSTVRTMLRRRDDEAVVLTPSACTITDPRGHRIELPWRQIERIDPLDYRGQRLVALFPYDAETVLDQASGRIARRLMRWNCSCLGTPIAIPMQTIRGDREELLATLRDYLRKYGR